MCKLDLIPHFKKIDELIDEINQIVPANASYRTVQFRADLAGLLVVAMAATYETCVKEVLYNYANHHHSVFGSFTQKNYGKLNSKIAIRDLKKYCEYFGEEILISFKAKLTKNKQYILNKTGKNIESSYEQILTWRHDFAHAIIRNTTIEEATKTHMYGKRILNIFAESFKV